VTISPPSIGSAPAEVRLLAPGVEAEWSRYVATHPGATLYHGLEWRDLVAAVFGHAPRYLVAVRDRRVAGVLPMFQVRFPGLGRKLVSLPYDVGSGGPLADDAEAEAALALAARQLAVQSGVSYVQLRCASPRPGVESVGFERSEPVLISDLHLAAGDPWSRVSSDNRQSIRKAARRGVTVRPAESEADFEAFYRIYLRVFRAFGTPPYGPRYFPELWRRLGPGGHVRLLLAALNGRTVGGLLLFTAGRNWVSKFAACEPESVSARTYAALYGAAIDLAVAEKADRLSWGSSAPRQRGLIEFKERWGAVTAPAVLYSQAIGGRVPSLEAYYDEDGLARRVWRRLPLGLTVSLGEVLNRWFC
jgi:hypothetical protein